MSEKPKRWPIIFVVGVLLIFGGLVYFPFSPFFLALMKSIIFRLSLVILICAFVANVIRGMLSTISKVDETISLDKVLPKKALKSSASSHISGLRRIWEKIFSPKGD